MQHAQTRDFEVSPCGGNTTRWNISKGNVRLTVEESGIRGQLQSVLNSEQFAAARRLSAFLEFAVTSKLAGVEVKESLIGVEVYGREATYNPKTDSIVRAEASRLRAKLREYYDGPGRSDPWIIDLPKGSYVPVFQARPPAPVAVEAPGMARRIAWRRAALPVAVIAAVVGVWWAVGGPRPGPSVAIAPVRALGTDPGIQVVADSLTSHLTKVLLAARSWKVAGRIPPVELSSDSPMPPASRKDLKTDVILTGSLRPTGNRDARLTLELVNASDGYLLWHDTYDRPLQAMADTQAEMARLAVAAFTRRYTGRPEAPYNADYEQAREFWRAYTPSGLAQSIPHFQKAVRNDPKFAAAWAGMADAYIRLSDDVSDIDTRDKVEAARAAAGKALALDEANAEAHAALGRIYLYKDWDFRRGVERFQRAVALDPTRVAPQISYAQALTIVGDLQGALDAIHEARGRLPALPDVLMQEGSVYFLARKFEKMEAVGREMLAIDADNPSAFWLVGLSLEQRGKVSESIREFEAGLRAAARDDLRILCALSHAYGLLGDRKRAFEVQRKYLPDPEGPLNRFTLCYCAALTYAGLGDKDGAFRWLAKARRIHDQSLPFTPFDPRFDALRGDPRYAPLVEPVTAHHR